VYAENVGYVQQISMSALQSWAKEHDTRVVVAALPGTFASPDRALAYVDTDTTGEEDRQGVAKAFKIGDNRLFDDDPRFGLVVLAEIAGRALSPAVNDPGTAIQIIGSLVRLFKSWAQVTKDGAGDEPKYDRVEVPELSARDLLDDAFTAIARDGAGTVEVAVRLQKALKSLAAIGDTDLREAAEQHAQLALKRAEKALVVAEDLATVRAAWH
jgi:uncharacterized membrane protein